MWIMIVMSSFIVVGSSNSRAVTSLGITSIEFSSRERCVNAAEFTRKQPKIYHTFCVQK
ncbi:MAG: hypothetical protein RR959_08905 [Erysipelotrichaceae bacterium]